MYQELLKQIQENGTMLVTIGGEISPYLGAGIAVLVTLVLIFLSFKVKRLNWKTKKKEAGESIGTNTASDQQTINSVYQNIKNFFKEKK